MRENSIPNPSIDEYEHERIRRPDQMIALPSVLSQTWILFAFGSAIFAGATSILAKIGIRNVDSDLATALRTIVVVIFAWIMVFIVSSQDTLPQLTLQNWTFLIASGVATGASWLCYYKAIQMGDVSRVVPIDKSSLILTMLIAIGFLGENFSILKGVAILGIGAGTFLMISTGKKQDKSPKNNLWILFAALSALFASLTSILAKVGIVGVESNLATGIRTIVVLIMAWLFVLLKGTQSQIRSIDKKGLLFIGLSGLATGLSWLCFYHALQVGPASVVVPIDKLSIFITVAFGVFVLKEPITKKAVFGLACIGVGTICLLI
jgi:transporter family protein